MHKLIYKTFVKYRIVATDELSMTGKKYTTGGYRRRNVINPIE